MEKYCNFEDSSPLVPTTIDKLEDYAKALRTNFQSETLPSTDLVGEIVALPFAELNQQELERLNAVYETIQTVVHIKSQWRSDLNILLLAISSADFFSQLPLDPLDLPAVPLSSLTTKLHRVASLIFKLSSEELDNRFVQEVRGKLSAHWLEFSQHWDILSSEEPSFPLFNLGTTCLSRTSEYLRFQQNLTAAFPHFHGQLIDKAMAALPVDGGVSVREMVCDYTKKAAKDFHASSGLPDGTTYYLMRNSTSESTANCITASVFRLYEGQWHDISVRFELNSSEIPSCKEITARVLHEYCMYLYEDSIQTKMLDWPTEVVPIPLPERAIQKQYVNAVKEGRQYVDLMYYSRSNVSVIAPVKPYLCRIFFVFCSVLSAGALSFIVSQGNSPDSP
ncbi:MAG: hypothetical protein Q8K75_05330 [Chlamydiales bacterium]|nr:hypothetical protein [Chlamydiales bacterium]